MLLPEDVALCCVPRSRKSVNLYGFDHAERLCIRLAKQVGVKARPELLYRTSGKNREQKKLTSKERVQNTASAFGVDLDLLNALGGTVKCLFLVDDVITTGASIGGCAACLREVYQGPIVAVCIARTALGRRKSAKVRG